MPTHRAPRFTPFRRHVSHVLLACAVFGAVATIPRVSHAADTVTFPTFSLADLQHDFDRLQNIAETQHPLIYADRAELQSAFALERTRLRDGMNELEFFRVLRDLVRRLNCGHTNLSLSAATEAAVNADRRLFPAVVKHIDGRLFATRTLPGSSLPAGAEILEINGRTSAEILRQLTDLLPADGSNVTWKFNAINQRFSHHYYLLVDAASEFSVSYLDPLTRTPAITSLAGAAPAAWADLEDPSPPDNDGLGSTRYEADYATLHVKSFFYYDAAGRARFNAFVDNFFDEVAARGIDRVVLDLRGNGGGDPYCGAYLFRHLIDRPLPYFAANSAFYPELKSPLPPTPNAFVGSLYVLIDGGCFSTTGHFLSLLKFHNVGHLIGDESGGSFSCTSNNRSTTLDRTRLSFSYATSTFTTAVSGLAPGRGVMPDYPVVPTARDHLLRHDPSTTLALSLMNNPGRIITRHPDGMSAAADGRVSFSLQAADSTATYRWQLNGTQLGAANDTPTFAVEAAQLQHTGLYSAVVTTGENSQFTRPAILGWISDDKAVGGTEVLTDIQHPNTNIYDQVLLRESFASITADPGQITRLSFVDLQDDIVQIEFSGAGTLAVSLDAASPPAAPELYVQPSVTYAKGHARIVIAGADETTNVAVFSVGRANAVDQTLFRANATYDGWADIASIAILSANGKFGGVFTGNTRYTGVAGPIGLYAPDVTFVGPVRLGDLHASDDARPMLVIGSAETVHIGGGDFEQLNSQPVEVGSMTPLHFTPGSDSHNRSHPAQTNRARFERDGLDVTASIVASPAP